MIRIYTSSSVLDSDESDKLCRRVIEESKDPTHVISFPECTYHNPTHPYELMSSFKSYIYKMMKTNQEMRTNQDLWVVTYSTLVCDIIRLCAKELNLSDAVEIYDFTKDERIVRVTSVDANGRMYNTVKGLFDAEEQILLKLI